MLYFLPAPYFRRLRVDEVFQELSGFLWRALSPRIRCRPAQSAKLYSLSKDLAGRNPQSSCNFDSFHTPGITWLCEHVELIDVLIVMAAYCRNLLLLCYNHIWSSIFGALCTMTTYICTHLFSCCVIEENINKYGKLHTQYVWLKTNIQYGVNCSIKHSAITLYKHSTVLNAEKG